MRVGADTGGTFTDVVAADGSVAKVPSTPADPGAAVRGGVAAVADGAPELLCHGTTAATNALLEGKGAAVALVTTSRSEEHTSELQSLMRISYAVFCLKNKTHTTHIIHLIPLT